MVRTFTYIALLGIFVWLAGVLLQWWPPVAGRLDWTVLGGAAALFALGVAGVALNGHLDKRRYQPTEDELHDLIISEMGPLNMAIPSWRMRVVDYLVRQIALASQSVTERERDDYLGRAIEVADLYDIDPAPFYNVGRRVYRTYIPKRCRWLMEKWKHGQDIVIFFETGEKPEGLRGIQPEPYTESARDPSEVPPARVPELTNGPRVHH